MNFFRRFEYPMTPVADDLARMPPASGVERPGRLVFARDTHGRLAAATRASVITLIAAYLHIAAPSKNWQDARHDLGQVLFPLRDRGYVMAVSKAGLLPFYSDWRAIDTWGLNDRWIAHHGHVTEEYLDRSRPHLLMYHLLSAGDVSPGGSPLERMVSTLRRYAESRHYLVAGAFGRPEDATYYYVRSDFDGRDELLRIIGEWARQQELERMADSRRREVAPPSP
jgi:hypothetical protein